MGSKEPAQLSCDISQPRSCDRTDRSLVLQVQTRAHLPGWAVGLPRTAHTDSFHSLQDWGAEIPKQTGLRGVGWPPSPGLCHRQGRIPCCPGSSPWPACREALTAERESRGADLCLCPQAAGKAEESAQERQTARGLGPSSAAWCLRGCLVYPETGKPKGCLLSRQWQVLALLDGARK